MGTIQFANNKGSPMAALVVDINLVLPSRGISLRTPPLERCRLD